MQFNNLKILDNKKYKICKSFDYNFIFNRENGFFARWGKTKKENPIYGPSPEILDLEISSGKCSGRCKFCYKNNGEDINTYHMTFEKFKIIFHKMPKTLLQIAFGICDIKSNPDFFKMMRYAKEHGVIPNYTCNGLDVTPEIAKETSEICGAVAVSLVNKEKTYDAIKKFSIDNNMNQCNIHYMLSLETYERAFEIIDDISTDNRLKNFNAIVFLQYKHKNLNSLYHSILNIAKYKALTDYCESRNVRYGFDSCSGPIFIESLLNTPNRDFVEMFVEPCESGLFSSYINCHGQFFVCSFAEGEDNWKVGIDVLGCDDFLKDVWHHPRLWQWRKRLLAKKRECPIYDLSMETV